MQVAQANRIFWSIFLLSFYVMKLLRHYHPLKLSHDTLFPSYIFAYLLGIDKKLKCFLLRNTQKQLFPLSKAKNNCISIATQLKKLFHFPLSLSLSLRTAICKSHSAVNTN